MHAPLGELAHRANVPEGLGPSSETEMPGMKGLRQASCLRFGIAGIADYHVVQLLSMWVGRVGVITTCPNMEFWASEAKWQRSYFAGPRQVPVSVGSTQPFIKLISQINDLGHGLK